MKKYIILLLTVFILKSISNAYDIAYQLEEEVRVKGEAGLYYEHTQLTATLKYNKYLQPFIGYKLEFEDKLNTSMWSSKQQALLGNTVNIFNEKKYGKLDFRTQFEYAFIGTGGNDFRTRERLKYNTPWKFTKLEINPFIYDEVFFDLYHGHGFNNNRAGAGVDFKIYKNLNGSLFYYLNSSKKNDNWIDSNIVALQAKVNF